MPTSKTTEAELSIALKILPDNIITNKCTSCVGAKCCQYTTVEVATPRSIRDFDNLLWQVSHHNTHVFKDPSGWFLLFYQKCEHLADNGSCLIYQNRPFVCREHDNNNCEYDLEMDEGCDLYFQDYQSFNDYCQTRFKSWNKRF